MVDTLVLYRFTSVEGQGKSRGVPPAFPVRAGDRGHRFKPLVHRAAHEIGRMQPSMSSPLS